MIKFSEVAHLYFHTECLLKRFDEAVYYRGKYCDLIQSHFVSSIESIRPLLRPLSDMTEDEALTCGEILGGMSHLSNESKIFQTKDLLTTNRLYVAQTNISGIRWINLTVYLLKQGFDIFGLIENGEALDKTKC